MTASLVFGGAIFWLTLSIPIGILSALRPRSLLDRSAMTFVLVGIAAHPVWIGLILLYFISFKAGLTPIGNYCDFFNPGLGEHAGVHRRWHRANPGTCRTRDWSPRSNTVCRPARNACLSP